MISHHGQYRANELVDILITAGDTLVLPIDYWPNDMWAVKHVKVSMWNGYKGRYTMYKTHVYRRMNSKTVIFWQGSRDHKLFSKHFNAHASMHAHTHMYT